MPCDAVFEFKIPQKPHEVVCSVVQSEYKIQLSDTVCIKDGLSSFNLLIVSFFSRAESPILGWVSNHESRINVLRVEMKYINIIEANLVISQYSLHNKMSNLEIFTLIALRSNFVTSKTFNLVCSPHISLIMSDSVYI